MATDTNTGFRMMIEVETQCLMLEFRLWNKVLAYTRQILWTYGSYLVDGQKVHSKVRDLKADASDTWSQVVI